MQQSAHPTTTERTPRKVAGVIAIALGAILTTVGLSAGTAAGEEPPPTQTVPLNNIEAPTENTSECPNAIDDFWHFVIAGGQGFSFVSITLNLDGDPVTFTGSEIILNPNNLKPDNVYVMVPDGYTFADLAKDGSSAQITPAAPAVKFVLSHFCDGPGRPTTTTTVAETTTTVAETTTTLPETTTTVAETTTTVAETTTTLPETTTTVAETTTTVAETTTTLPETTTTVAETTTTVAETTTTLPETTTTVAETTTTVAETTTTAPDETTTSVASEGPTTTTTAPEEVTTTTASASAAVTTTTLATELPRTGSDLSRSLAVLGGLLVVIGGVLLLTVRRTATS